MRVLLSAIVAVLVFAAPAAAASPDIVISQVYGGGGNAGAQYKNDFIELYNRGTDPVPVTGWSVQYASSAGTTWTNLTPLTGTIQPGRYYLVQEAAGANTTLPDLPTPNATGSINMSATAGKVALVTNNANLTCAADCDTAAGVKDFVGYGGANDSETAPTPTLTNATAALRNGGGTVDTDNNLADFTVGPPTPRNSPPPVSVTSTNPADGANDVPLNSNVTITFSGPVDVTASNFTITCTKSGAHPFALSGGPSEYTLDPDADFVREESCTVTVHTDDVDKSITFATVGVEGLRIHDIQGARHVSPYDDRIVSGVPGVVTAVDTNGFYMQDNQPDADERTSEGIFVFTSSKPRADIVMGALVHVSGTVNEFDNFTATNLSITEIASPTVTVDGPGTTPAPTVIGQGGRIPPNRVIDNDSNGNVDTGTLFDPQQDGIDFHESIEGMLVQFNDAVATGPTNGFRELSIVADNGRNAGLRTPRGGVIVQRDDFNPERFILDDGIVDETPVSNTPNANTGDKLSSPIVAVADYSFGNFKYYPLHDVTATGSLQHEVTDTPGANELEIASFNVENLAPPPINPPSKFAGLADTLVHNLKSPDIVAVEEIQDNDGATGGTASPVTDASVTWNTLIAAIAAAGGPAYQYRQIDPVDDQDGGEPGGNIRQGFLFRTDRGLAFVDRPGGTSTNSTSVVRTRRGAQLTFSPGRIHPENTAFTTSRKPLAGEFTWKGKTLIVVANHFNSKGGDDPLFGRHQPPIAVTEDQRHKQATIVNTFARDIQRADPLGDYVVLGDLNDFEFSETLQILQGFQMLDLYYLLPPNERYSYVFDGNSQALDHILVSPALLFPLPEYDSVHVNAEFTPQQSDHDPQVARLRP
jgi:predicted extracellular nuclease